MAEQVGTLAMFQHGVARRVTLQNGDPVLVYNAGSSSPATGGRAEPHMLLAVGDVCPHKRAPLSDGDIEDLGQGLGVCIRCPKHRRKFNGGGLYFSLADGSSHIRGDADSCRKYNPGWSVPAYNAFADEAGTVFVVQRGVGDAAVGSAAVAVAAAPHGADQGSSSRWQQWSINRVEPVSDNSGIFHFSRVSATPVPEEQFPDCPSSWHVTMRLRYAKKPGGKEKKVDREYTPISSLASLTAGIMAILIKVYPEGKLTSRLAQMAAGAVVEFSRPEPTLCLVPAISLPPDGSTLMEASLQAHRAGTAEAGAAWAVGMVAGGTGIAPIWQLLVAMREHPTAFGGTGCSARLVYTNRRRQDILMMAELTALAAEDHADSGDLDFTVLHTLTGEVELDGWNGATGHITEEMLRSTLPAPSSRTVVVICGPTGMNEVATRLLRRMGYPIRMLVELEA